MQQLTGGCSIQDKVVTTVKVWLPTWYMQVVLNWCWSGLVRIGQRSRLPIHQQYHMANTLKKESQGSAREILSKLGDHIYGLLVTHIVVCHINT